jgi:hypothetical protein
MRAFFTAANKKKGDGIEYRLHTDRNPKGKVLTKKQFEEHPKKWVKNMGGYTSCFALAKL